MTLLAWRRTEQILPTAAVLVHGWGQDASVWDPWREALSEAGLAPLACDLPGHADSAELSAPRGVDLARWAAEAISRDLATLGVTDVRAVGFSEGCMVAAHLAVASGVARVALLAPDVDYPPHHAGEAAAALRDPRARLWSPEASDLVAKARTGRHSRAVLADWLERASWPGAARLRGIGAPVLVAAGSGDPNRHLAPKLASVLSDGRLTTATGAGESLLASPPLRRTVVSFLSEASR